MDFDELNNYCLSKQGAYIDFPFDETTAAFKIADKIFCLADVDAIPLSMNLKSDPEYALELIEQYDFITSGYHMNKKHWITITADDHHFEKLFKELVDNSYNLVFSKLSKTKQKEVCEQ